jgi:predicted nucleic acid-binding protein
MPRIPRKEAAPRRPRAPPEPRGPPDHADLNLVLATIKENDSLGSRAAKFLEGTPVAPVVPFAVGVELLFWCKKYGENHVHAMGACVRCFNVEKADVLLTAAHALQNEGLDSPFDAVHLAEALYAGVKLVTADEALHATKYPTRRY